MNRDPFFDNYKVLLIFLVVVGHFLSPLTKNSHLAEFIVKAIYTFHMPAFVFISAYFSKHNDLLKLMKTLMVPYAVFQVFYYILLHTIWNRGGSPKLFQPVFALWFLLSLFCWRILIDQLIRVKWLLPLSFLAGILVGFDTSIGAFASLGRTFAFFPFFLLGYRFDKDKFMKLADRKAIKAVSILLLGAILLLLYFKSDSLDFSSMLLKHSYKKTGDLPWGWLFRIAYYAGSMLMTFLVGVVLIPRKSHWFTYVGQRTMGIYLLHGLVLRSIQYMTGIYKNIDTNFELILMGLFAVALTFLLSTKPVDFVIRGIMKLPIEKLLHSTSKIN